jgi:hypothetical protein
LAIKLLATSLLLLGAEVLASGWLWARAPVDTLRVWYPTFWGFERGRLYYWTIAFACSALLGAFIWYALQRRVATVAMKLVAAALAMTVEGSTSVWHWKSAASVRVRGLYESIWYWNRVPLPADLGWPSFWGYLWAHLVPWAALLLCAVAWYSWSRTRRVPPTTPAMQ